MRRGRTPPGVQGIRFRCLGRLLSFFTFWPGVILLVSGLLRVRARQSANARKRGVGNESRARVALSCSLWGGSALCGLAWPQNRRVTRRPFWVSRVPSHPGRQSHRVPFLSGPVLRHWLDLPPLGCPNPGRFGATHPSSLIAIPTPPAWCPGISHRQFPLP